MARRRISSRHFDDRNQIWTFKITIFTVYRRFTENISCKIYFRLLRLNDSPHITPKTTKYFNQKWISRSLEIWETKPTAKFFFCHRTNHSLNNEVAAILYPSESLSEPTMTQALPVVSIVGYLSLSVLSLHVVRQMREFHVCTMKGVDISAILAHWIAGGINTLWQLVIYWESGQHSFNLTYTTDWRFEFDTGRVTTWIAISIIKLKINPLILFQMIIIDNFDLEWSLMPFHFAWNKKSI